MPYPVRVAIYKEVSSPDAGWNVGGGQRVRLFAGPGRAYPLTRDWELVGVANGVIAGRVAVVASADLFEATHIEVDGAEHAVLSVNRVDQHLWEIRYGRRV